MTSKELLERIDKRNYLTEREHREFLKRLNASLDILEILKKYIEYDKEFNVIKCCGFTLTEKHKQEDFKKIKAWLDA